MLNFRKEHMAFSLAFPWSLGSPNSSTCRSKCHRWPSVPNWPYDAKRREKLVDENPCKRYKVSPLSLHLQAYRGEITPVTRVNSAIYRDYNSIYNQTQGPTLWFDHGRKSHLYKFPSFNLYKCCFSFGVQGYRTPYGIYTLGCQGGRSAVITSDCIPGVFSKRWKWLKPPPSLPNHQSIR